MKLKNFGDVEKFLLSKRPDINAVKWFFSLEDMKHLMAGLGNPQDKPKSIHVAGTSGKTSTCYYLSKFFDQAGAKVGLTVSPNVDSLNERVQINNEPISDEEFLELFGEFINLPEVRSTDITYFGLVAAFAFWVFAHKDLDYSVIEVGMGGRLDATNVINSNNKVCVITDIGLDHTKFLGDTLAQIASEKAGIILKNSHVFMIRQGEEVMGAVSSRCKQMNAVLHIIDPEDCSKAPNNLPPFQKRNWTLAKSVFDFVADRDGLTKLSEAIIKSVAQTKIPARMEVVKFNGKTLILDGSHNGQKIRALTEAIKSKFPGEKATVVLAMVEGKDSTLSESLRLLNGISESIIITEFVISQDIKRNPIDCSVIAEESNKAGFARVVTEPDPVKAFQLAISEGDGLVVVTGSFFLLNHIRPIVIGGDS